MGALILIYDTIKQTNLRNIPQKLILSQKFMANIHSSYPQENPGSELTLGDVLTFLVNAKFFALAGIVIGALAAISYLAITPHVYESKVVIQIQPSGNSNSINLVTVTPDELLERLNFSHTTAQIAKILQIPQRDEEYQRVNQSLKSAVIGKGGTFLTLTTKANSPDTAEKLAQKIADATIIFIAQLNAPKITYLEKLLDTNKQLIASGNNKIDIASLRTSNLALEALLGSPESLKPIVVDGPTFSNSSISPKTNLILLLGTLLGLGLGLLLFHFKNNYLKK